MAEKPIPPSFMKIMETKEFKRMLRYISGSYLLFSIVCLWWELADKELRKLFLEYKCRGLRFKQEFNACMKQMDRFERSVRTLMEEDDLKLIDDFETIEPMLKKYIFGEATIKETPKTKDE